MGKYASKAKPNGGWFLLEAKASLSYIELRLLPPLPSKLDPNSDQGVWVCIKNTIIYVCGRIMIIKPKTLLGQSV